MAKKTLDDLIEFHERMLDKYRAEKAAQDLKTDILDGDEITFKFGRGKTRKKLEGKVLGSKEDQNGKWIAVAHGEGFDLQRLTIRPGDVVANKSADKRANSEPPSLTLLKRGKVAPDDPLAHD